MVVLTVRMFASLAIKVIANAAALWVAAHYIAGFGIAPVDLSSFGFLATIAGFIGTLGATPIMITLLLAGILLAVVNAVLYPIAKVFGAIVPLITTAILMAAVNGVVLYAASRSLPNIILAGWKPTLLASLLLGIVNSIL